MSRVSAAFHDHPSDSIRVVGVTGTEGKSTTVSLVWQLLRLAGRKAGHISTVTSSVGGEEYPNPEHQTTPEAPIIHGMLAAMRDSGCEFAVLESSSHGLSALTARLADVHFDAGILTNITHEHLEFHGTWERYRHDKANLFRVLEPEGRTKTLRDLPCGAAQDSRTGVDGRRRVPAFGVVNADDPSATYFRSLGRAPVLTFSASGTAADFRALDIRSEATGSDFTIEGPGSDFRGGPAGSFPRRRVHVRIGLPGAFNVGNALAALAAVWGLAGIDWPVLAGLLPCLNPVRGRMSIVEAGQKFRVLVDYAHTPSSFETVLPPLRDGTTGRLICVFGSAGERDTAKRPLQGRVAAANSDVIILADEDPRGEDPRTILEEIASGIEGFERGRNLFLIPDRRRAIRLAFEIAGEGDLVVLLGKGHENSIIGPEGPQPYDEIGEAIAALGELTGSPPPPGDHGAA